MSDLDEWMADTYEVPPIEDEEARDAETIADDRKASWALRKLAMYQTEIDRCVELAEEEHARIDAWLADATHGAHQQVGWFQSLLANYAREIEWDPKGPSSRKVPGGVVGKRAGSTVLDVTDIDAFASWAEAKRPEWVRIKTEAEKGVIKKQVDAGITEVDGELVDDATGEIIPGVALVHNPETYYGKATP